jgi:LysR family hydrogen peroxide-inducible transcriptional activator
MNLRDLKYVIAVAETRHFGKAAERCFVTQPTLSGQIRKLEDQLGVMLFERTNRTVNITPAGEAILVHARRLVEQANAIEQLARAHQDPLAGPLRLGAIPTLSPYLMPLILVPLKRTHPQMHLVLSEEITHSLLQRLGEHSIDAALLATSVDDPELQTIPLFLEPFWLAHPRDHLLYTKDEITRTDLAELDLLTLADGHCLAQQVLEVCARDERAPRGELADLRAASLETLLQLVGAGYGCTLLPALAIRSPWLTDSGVIARPLAVDDAVRRVQLVFRASFPRRQALEALAQVIWSNLPNTVRPLGGPRGRVRSRSPGTARAS